MIFTSWIIVHDFFPHWKTKNESNFLGKNLALEINNVILALKIKNYIIPCTQQFKYMHNEIFLIWWCAICSPDIDEGMGFNQSSNVWKTKVDKKSIWWFININKCLAFLYINKSLINIKKWFSNINKSFINIKKSCHLLISRNHL